MVQWWEKWIVCHFLPKFCNVHKFSKLMSLIILHLPWGPNRISKTNSSQTKFIMFWPKPGSLLVLTVFHLTSIYSSDHIPVSSKVVELVSGKDGNGIFRLCDSKCLALCNVPSPLAIKKCEQSFLCNCVRESDEKIKQEPLRKTWKAACPPHRVLTWLWG